MKKLRVLLWPDCERNCDGCCNKDWDLESLPILEAHDLAAAQEILLTGGEPMLYPQRLINVICGIRGMTPITKPMIYVYTADVRNRARFREILKVADGFTVTLHDQDQVESFDELDLDLLTFPFQGEKSLRLNVFKGVKHHASHLWKVKEDMEWIPNCPLPEGEKFVRL